MKIGVPRESYPGERRVALVPAVIPSLMKAGFEVVVEAGAGAEAGYPDADYTAKGRQILPTRAEVFQAADIIVQVLCHGSNDSTGKDDLPLLRPGQILVGFLRPLGSIETIREIADRGVTSFAVELMPRTTRRRAWTRSPRWRRSPATRRSSSPPTSCRGCFPMLTTAAGTITPARVLVIGAGVAGLQAIATARRLGAVASAYDLRPAAKEQVQSLGGRFVELPVEAKDAQDARGYARAQDETFYERQRELLGRVVAESDVVITAAVIPGKKSPVLVTGGHGRADGAGLGDRRPGRRARRQLRADPAGGDRDRRTASPSSAGSTWPAPSPTTPARCTPRNLTAFLLHLVKDGKLRMDLNDEIIRDTLLTRGGEVVNARVREFFALPALPA